MLSKPDIRNDPTRCLETELAGFAAQRNTGMEGLRRAAEPILARVAADADLLKALLRRCEHDLELNQKCERDYDAVKLVLWQCADTKASLRLHRFLGSGPDRPHSHRWPFTARIVSGKYRHVIFLVKGPLRSGIGMSDTTVVMDRMELPGSMYSLGTDVMHSVDPVPDTLSLVLRGPAVSERLLVIDQARDDTYWHYGAEEDAAQSNRYTNRLEAGDLREEIIRIIGMIDTQSMARKPAAL